MPPKLIRDSFGSASALTAIHPIMSPLPGALVAVLVLTAACAAPPTPEVIPGMLLAPCPNTPNCVSTETTDTVHGMPPLTFSGSPEAAIETAREALLAEPRARLIEQRANYLHFEMRSRIFRFVDDVEIAIAPADSLLHFRSASRVGKGDMGVNRARMERFIARFRQLTNS